MSILISKIQSIHGIPAPPSSNTNVKPDPDWDYGQAWDTLLNAISFLEDTERSMANMEDMETHQNEAIIKRIDESIAHLVYVRDLIVDLQTNIPF